MNVESDSTNHTYLEEIGFAGWMLLEHQLPEMNLYSLWGFNGNRPVTVSVRRIPTWRSGRTDRAVIIRQSASANGLDTIPFKRESVVGYAVIRMEPKVQRVVRGHDISILEGESVAAKSANHLTTGVPAVVYLKRVIQLTAWSTIRVEYDENKWKYRSIDVIPVKSRIYSRSNVLGWNGWTWRSTRANCWWLEPRHSSVRADKRFHRSGTRDVPRDCGTHRRRSAVAFRICCQCTSTDSRRFARR